MGSFFTSDNNGILTPQDLSVSVWSDTQIGGYAICGALAREIEKTTKAPGFIPTRLTVDLFKPVRTEPLTLRSAIIRRGNRIVMTDATVIQAGEPRARATALYLPATEDPPGQVWHHADSVPTPPSDDHAEVGPPMITSGGNDWTADFSAHNNAERKAIWQRFPTLVDDEPLSPFQNAALIAENTSLICNWGTQGPGYINTDTTLTLTRLPAGHGIGLRADDQLSSSGIAIGTATLFDSLGAAGKCSVTAISNARRQEPLK